MKRSEIPEAVTYLGVALVVVGAIAAGAGALVQRHMRRKARTR